MFKQLLACAALVTMLMVNPVNAQQSPPTSEKAKQIEALVNKAAALIESKGKAIFSEFRTKGTEWFSGDTYSVCQKFFPLIPSPPSGGRGLG